MTERTPEVEINVDSTEFPDSVVIEIEILEPMRRCDIRSRWLWFRLSER